jgi:MFS superfamily sulfate permease-like transporter
LFYLASGLLYGLPIGVQPMKAASAAVLIQGMTPGQVAGAGLVLGVFFTLVGLTGLIGWLARITPASVVAGIQLGLGVALAILGIRLVEQQPVVGLSTGLVLLLLLGNRRLPAAVVGLAWSVALALALGQLPPLPPLTLGLHLPTPAVPSFDDLLRGTEIAVLPQIPLTLTNAIIVTSALARELFPDTGQRVTVKKLALSTGLGNLLTAPFGGYPMCHGASGLAGHYRFGARSATAPLLIGLSFLALGLLLGESAVALLRLVPEAALGALLLFGGLELATSSRVQRFAAQGGDLLVVLLVAVVAVASNAALAFGLGLLVAWGVQRGWVRW